MRRRFTILPSEVRQYYREGYLLKKSFIPENILKRAVVAGSNRITDKAVKLLKKLDTCTTRQFPL